MSTDYLVRLQTFTETTLPNLDEVVMGALAYLSSVTIPSLDVKKHAKPLVIGSVNGLNTARLLFRNTSTHIADEGTYMSVYTKNTDIDSIYIVSASGNKHAVIIAEKLQSKSIPVYLITSTPNAPAAHFVKPENVFVFPHVREPYTYNTSTYLGMLLSEALESPKEVLSFIEREVAPRIPDTLASYTSYIVTVPPEWEIFRAMFVTKFDELFAPLVTGRAFTSEEIKHAKIVVPSQTQYCINIGVEANQYMPEENQLYIPIPPSCGPATMLAIGYFIIGKIQGVHPPYFKDSIFEFVERAGKVFGQTVPVIVE